MLRGLILPALVLVFAAACGGNGEPAGGAVEEVPGFELTSLAFDEGGDIPMASTCDGADRLPALKWTGVPRGTVELALIVEDPDAVPLGGAFVHAVAFGIDADDSGLPPRGTATYATNDFEEEGYRGPCPPEGDPPHRYVFALYALGAALTLEPGISHEDAREAIESAAIAR
ncbi:MAG: YbhB/YbcL family Raf kinase inhibitor-like protein, partial [Actinomycetota bacterium]